MVKVKDFFAEDEVFEQGRAARAGFQRILVVRDRRTLLGRQHVRPAPGGLMRFAARPSLNLGIDEADGFELVVIPRSGHEYSSGSGLECASAHLSNAADAAWCPPQG
jgi:hypothetical protein